MNHSLHKKIGAVIDNALKGHIQIRVIKDPACCTDSHDKQHIPLFVSEVKNRSTRYCCVDLLILQDDKIRIIIEIEESDIKPTQICGKFLTSALSEYYIHDKDDGSKEMGKSVTFIQVLDTSKLKDRSVKEEQFLELEKSINKILPLKGRPICQYKLFVGKEKSEFNEMLIFIKKELMI
ncbi:MAG TPA: hypothetical protein HPP97_06520 [Desulfuromonadales bacterium]|nr:hypothetical protein [Desulfuromonadales bacterium]